MKNLKEYTAASIDNKTLLAICPHPDDETLPIGGLLLEAKRAGWKTSVICLTKGGAGKVSFQTDLATEKLRMAEFKKAVQILGVSKYYLLDFTDGSLRDSQAVVEKRLSKFLEEIKPGVVVTYDHSGATGHPDHILTSLVVHKLVEKSDKKITLLWVSFRGIARKFNKKSKTFRYFTTPNLYLSLSLQSRFKKTKAYLQHKSQIPSFKVKTLFVLYCLFISETYHIVDVKKNYQYKYVVYNI